MKAFFFLLRRSPPIGSSSNAACILSPVLGFSVFPADAAEAVAVEVSAEAVEVEVSAEAVEVEVSVVEAVAEVVSAETYLASTSVCLAEPSEARTRS